MTMGDRIKSKRTLRNATPTTHKDAPTGGQTGQAGSSRLDDNNPEKGSRATSRLSVSPSFADPAPGSK